MFKSRVRVDYRLEDSLFFCLLLLCGTTSAELLYTNIICKSVDEDYATIDYCFLKAINRTYKYFSLKVKLLKVPITSIDVNFALLKRANGYKPFLYNITFDACKFSKNRKANPVGNFIFKTFEKFTNMNHPCPIDHDIIVEKVDSNFLNNQYTNILPFPKGDYAVDTHWNAYRKNSIDVRLYFTIN